MEILKFNENKTSVFIDNDFILKNKIKSIFAWQKSENKKIDLTHLFKNSNILEITVNDLLVKEFNDLWFINVILDKSLFTANCNTKTNKITYVILDIDKYKECILNKVLEIQIEDCNLFIKANKECDCGCDEDTENKTDDCVNKVLYGHMLLNVLPETIKKGYTEEIKKIIEKLNDICEICHSCL